VENIATLPRLRDSVFRDQLVLLHMYNDKFQAVQISIALIGRLNGRHIPDMVVDVDDPSPEDSAMWVTI
jgi:hypothetical protein